MVKQWHGQAYLTARLYGRCVKLRVRTVADHHPAKARTDYYKAQPNEPQR
jgi:hypothetical protein